MIKIGNPSKFYMVIEKEFAEKSFELALDIVRKFSDSKRTKEQEHLRRIGQFKVIRKIDNYKYEFGVKFMSYGIEFTSSPSEDLRVILLKSFVTPSREEDTRNFYNLCFELSKNIDPLYSIGGDGIGVSDYGPAWVSIEHYRNPYFFCLEPPKSNGYGKNFIENEAMIRKAVEIEKVLPRNKLLNLLRAHCKKVAIGPKMGVIVFKGYTTNDAIALRYYLAKEVRNRGVELEEGDAEQFAKKLKMEEE